jgi:hypothetical protein
VAAARRRARARHDAARLGYRDDTGMNLREDIEKAVDEAFRKHIAHMVGILMTATDDERKAFERFLKGARKAIDRRARLLQLINEAEI